MKLELTKPKTSGVKQLRARHHRLAQLLALGAKPEEAAAALGYSASRVYVLQSQDPAFRALIDFYASEVAERALDLGSEMKITALEAIREVQRRLEQNPDEFSAKELTQLIEMLADRTGYGPSSKTEVNVTRSVAKTMESIIDAEAEVVDGD